MGWILVESKMEIVYLNTWLNCIFFPGFGFVTTDDCTFMGQVLYKLA